jgi:predicted DNA-binding transcriptional regulator AlpA
MSKALLDVKGAVDFYGVSTATIWRWAKEKRIPQPVKIGLRFTRWRTAGIHKPLKNVVFQAKYHQKCFKNI